MTPPKTPIPYYSEPTDDDDEAQHRFDATFDNDPFPDIPCALLNSSDLYDYVRATGMVCPFSTDLLKSASYGAKIGTTCIFWDGKGKLVDKSLAETEVFTLPPNSIAFISTKEKFRLPNYIAMRFNLTINNVHRGILLGTGPMVDPGYEGQLLIPLHNLTTNSYRFKAGDSFIWIEFTKTSPYPTWHPDMENLVNTLKLSDQYQPFPKEKKNLNPWDYLNEAYKGSIRSSIPDALESSRKSAQQAKRTTQIFSGAAIVGALGLGAAVFFGGANLLSQLNSRAQHNSELATRASVEIEQLQRRIEELLLKITEESARIRGQLNDQSRTELEGIRNRLTRLNERLGEMERKTSGKNPK